MSEETSILELRIRLSEKPSASELKTEVLDKASISFGVENRAVRGGGKVYVSKILRSHFGFMQVWGVCFVAEIVSIIIEL